MTRASRSFRGLIGGFAVSAAALAMTATPAMAITTPTPAGDPPTPTDSQEVTLSWGESFPDPGGTITGYQVESADSPGGAATSSVTVGPQALSAQIATSSVGLYYLRVRALQDIEPAASDYLVRTVLVDRAAPTISTSFLGTPAAGFYPRPLTIKLTCGDDNPLPGGTCANITWNTDGKNIAGQTASVTDAAGKTTTVAIPAFSVDGTAPTKPAPTSTGELVPDQPTFAWLPSVDAVIGSGVDRYEVQWQEDDDAFSPSGWKLLVTVKDTGGPGEYKAPPASWSGGPLPVNTPLRWRVVASDNVGNRANSSVNGLPLVIDPTVPAAPVITGGPSAPTRDSSPTFTWAGDGARFQWSITLAGSATPIRGGAGSETSATVPNLPDGAYVLHVTQFTAAQRESAEASRSFAIDTTPPAAPAILSRPTFPAIGIPTFTWSIEPGAYSRWSVVDSAGALVFGPVETPVTTAELPTLPEGPYTFQVAQYDAAGNLSPQTAEGFSVLAPLVAPTPADDARTAFLSALPKQNALRLQPKAGTTLPTLRPVLRWKKGPRGTKLYNLQIFQVTPGKGTKAKPRIRKVLSRFPRGLQFRPSNKSLKPSTCYVWRVWPYTGTAFTARPVGVSNFCVAGRKVLRAKAARAAANRAAAKARR